VARGPWWHRESGGTVALVGPGVLVFVLGGTRWHGLSGTSTAILLASSSCHQEQRRQQNCLAKPLPEPSNFFDLAGSKLPSGPKFRLLIQASVMNLASRLAPQLRFLVSVKGWTDSGKNRVLRDVSARRLIASL